METTVLTVDEVARLLRLSQKTVRMKAAAGELPAKKVGKVWRFVQADLEEYLRGEPSRARLGSEQLELGVSERSRG